MISKAQIDAAAEAIRRIHVANSDTPMFMLATKMAEAALKAAEDIKRTEDEMMRHDG